MAKGLNELRDAAYANSTAHGFHDEAKSFGDDIALMHSELSEALEDFRAGHAPGFVWYEAKGVKSSEPTLEDGTLLKPCGIPSELADVIIRIFDFSGKHGIDIERAVHEKMAFNVTRPFMHGKKL